MLILVEIVAMMERWGGGNGEDGGKDDFWELRKSKESIFFRIGPQTQGNYSQDQISADVPFKSPNKNACISVQI